jgi:hypothetical protein
VYGSLLEHGGRGGAGGESAPPRPCQDTAMSDRPPFTVVSGQPGAVSRRILFERAHPEVAILPPAGLSDRWRAIVPLGKIPGHPDVTTIGSYGLGGLMDQLDECYLPDGTAV